MSLHVESVRAQFPALRGGTAHFDGPGGSQVPRCVAEAVASTLLGGLSNRGHVTAAARRADQVVLEARAAMADLARRRPARRRLRPEHDLADLRPGPHAGAHVVARRRGGGDPARPRRQHPALGAGRGGGGATVRWVGFDPDTGELRPEDVAAELSGRTRLVAVTGASNLLGTRPDLPAIADLVHARDALFFVDGVHLVPHAPVDLAALGADFLRLLARTSSSARTAASSPPPRAARDRCSRTSCCPPPTPCPSGSSSARCPTS